MNVAKPHRIDASVVYGMTMCVASSVTADHTMIKRLMVGFNTCKVTRRYRVEADTETVYEGGDINEAVRIYNGMG